MNPFQLLARLFGTTGPLPPRILRAPRHGVPITPLPIPSEVDAIIARAERLRHRAHRLQVTLQRTKSETRNQTASLVAEESASAGSVESVHEIWSDVHHYFRSTKGSPSKSELREILYRNRCRGLRIDLTRWEQRESGRHFTFYLTGALYSDGGGVILHESGPELLYFPFSPESSLDFPKQFYFAGTKSFGPTITVSQQASISGSVHHYHWHPESGLLKEYEALTPAREGKPSRPDRRLIFDWARDEVDMPRRVQLFECELGAEQYSPRPTLVYTVDSFAWIEEPDQVAAAFLQAFDSWLTEHDAPSNTYSFYFNMSPNLSDRMETPPLSGAEVRRRLAAFASDPHFELIGKVENEARAADPAEQARDAAFEARCREHAEEFLKRQRAANRAK